MEHSHTSHMRQSAPVSVFLAMTVVLFFLSLSAADSIGFVPDYIDGTAQSDAADTIALSELPELGEASSTIAMSLPTHMTIAAIGIDLPVQNPSTRDIAALDELLKAGPVRYVDSAKLGETGTMIIFAHSSHLPVVRNPMYKAFNRVPELKAGDMMTLHDGTTAYLYAVTSVTTADASDTKIDTSPALGTRLVLVTCDTLTGKSARFVVEASFVGSYAL